MSTMEKYIHFKEDIAGKKLYLTNLKKIMKVAKEKPGKIIVLKGSRLTPVVAVYV